MGFFIVIMLFIVPAIISEYWHRSFSTQDKDDKYNPDSPWYKDKYKYQ